MMMGVSKQNLRPLYYTTSLYISIIKWSQIFVSTPPLSSVIISHHHLELSDDEGEVKTKIQDHFIVLIEYKLA